MDATVFIATSLDGFIAREDGGIDWLTPIDPAGGEDYGYHAFFASVNALVMGRNTYELVRTFGDWPYGTKPVVVLTSRPIEIPESISDTVEAMSGSPLQVASHLAGRGIERLYVDGGRTIQSFLAHDLIRRLIITTIPILIGHGIPLFGPLPRDVALRHVATRTFRSGLVQSEYEVATPEPSDEQQARSTAGVSE